MPKQIRLVADDGSEVFINPELVVEVSFKDDNVHVVMAAGPHPDKVIDPEHEGLRKLLKALDIKRPRKRKEEAID